MWILSAYKLTMLILKNVKITEIPSFLQYYLLHACCVLDTIIYTEVLAVNKNNIPPSYILVFTKWKANFLI